MTWVIFILFSAFTRGIGDVFYKKLSFDFTPQTILLISAFLNLVFLTPTFGGVGLLETKLFILVFLKAVAMTTGWLLFLYSLKKLPISIATPLQMLSTLFSIIFGFLFLKESLTPLQSAGIIILLSGVLSLQLLSKKEKKDAETTNKILSKAFFLGIIASFFSALSLTLDRYLLRDLIDPVNLQFWFYIFILTNTLAVFLLLKTPAHKEVQNLRSKWWIFIILSFFLVISDKTYMIAATYPLALLGLLIPMKRLSIIVSVFIGGKAFKEKNLGSKIFATLVMLAGLCLMVW
ncbi:DMT family transporter [uncultured Desulfobacter sp.]|uniref:EamA family transporter n=1 Tax=uncultured Desulfobacter sp. TaxID=240139 RepID=UPI002AABBDF3|nr:DMT family transporter [uncultured Desulfobacter sp.]